jgi:thiamine biosynthesis lipoprotein
MGTQLDVIVVGPECDRHDAVAHRLADRAVERLAELESRWSRFRADSEVSRLNAAPGTAVEVSADTVRLVRCSVEAWKLSAGFVDATELAAVVDAGYDRSFELLPSDRSAGPQPRRPVSLAGPADIRIDGTTITLPAGVGFDPGGIGKGLAADLVSGELIRAGAAGACVNVGGDLRVRGASPDGSGWTISIDHPHRRAPIALVGLTDGGVASSTTLRRRWLVGGEIRHHLIDPRTGRPSTSDTTFCSAIAGSAWRAETVAKAVLLRGGTHPFDIVDAGMEALVVDHAGDVRTTGGFTRFTGGIAPPAHLWAPLDRQEARA